MVIDTTKLGSPLMMTKRNLKLFFGVLVLGAAVVFVPRDAYKRWMVRRDISALASPTFGIKRHAQNRIVRQGVSALPELLAAFDTTHDEQQKALICYLIGSIDPARYGQILLSSNAAQNVCVISRYLNKEAVRSMRKEERDAIAKHYRDFAGSLSHEQRNCATSVIQQIEER